MCVGIRQSCRQIPRASYGRGAEQAANIAEHLACGLISLPLCEHGVVPIHLDENRRQGLFCGHACHSYHGCEGSFWCSLDVPYRGGSSAHGQCKAIHACFK